jgi:hypothetical protein
MLFKRLLWGESDAVLHILCLLLAGDDSGGIRENPIRSETQQIAFILNNVVAEMERGEMRCEMQRDCVDVDFAHSTNQGRERPRDSRLQILASSLIFPFTLTSSTLTLQRFLAIDGIVSPRLGLVG